MLINILIALAVLLVLLIIFVSMRPSAFRITRKATIAAPPSAVFPHVNDFHNWRAWSPWEKLDPALQRTYEGPSAGAGASYAWQGNKQVGEGRMTIVDSRPPQLINIKLEFFKPFVATNAAEFAFAPVGSQTEVTWTMTGTNNFMFKAMGLFMNMDKMLGSTFDEGLANLKRVVETSA